MAPLRIGTRGSALALWQANFVAERLRTLAAPRTIDLIQIQTTGDQIRDVPLATIGGDGLFTKEIQRALLAGAVDVAVHSLKDLPTIAVEGLMLGAVPPRGPAGDVMIAGRHGRFDDLPRGASVATSSLRRRAQALHRRPDLRILDIRGNVETRLKKLTDLGLDAIILAQAGLERLGLGDAITEILDRAWMLPAVGQGALGLECRVDDRATQALLNGMDDAPTRQMVLAERALLRALGGGCLVPIGVVTALHGDCLSLRGAVLAPDGKQRLEGQIEGPWTEPDRLGQQLARDLLALGAAELLAATRR